MRTGIDLSNNGSITEFTGIKYSEVTKIFYKMDNKKRLLKFPVHSSTGREWSFSDYQDYSRNSSNWVKATDKQISKYRLEK